MNFGTVFTSWISMLHEGAMTRFIISGLTRAIRLLFSIRQGDPIAMLLYIIYVEPLLQALEKRMTGLKVIQVFSHGFAECGRASYQNGAKSAGASYQSGAKSGPARLRPLWGKIRMRILPIWG